MRLPPPPHPRPRPPPRLSHLNSRPIIIYLYIFYNVQVVLLYYAHGVEVLHLVVRARDFVEFVSIDNGESKRIEFLPHLFAVHTTFSGRRPRVSGGGEGEEEEAQRGGSTRELAACWISLALAFRFLGTNGEVELTVDAEFPIQCVVSNLLCNS